ncbi:MAG: exo-alpha-sialidase [Planctomycetes bacterium]|nr:exo-alpha-sialidase [Planctomycetota bacterium]
MQHNLRLSAAVLTLLGAAPLCAQSLPTSSTLPRGEYQLNDDFLDVGTHGWGSWKVASPRQVIAAGPAGTVPTAQVAYVTYLDRNTAGDDLIQFRRSIDGGYTWQAPVTVYTLAATEFLAAGETRLVAYNHEVYIVYASNGHNLAGNDQSVWALGSPDQGQTWSAPLLMSPGMLTTLKDADEVNAAVSFDATGGYLDVVFEADAPNNGFEDIYFSQAKLQAGPTLALTVTETRLNHAVAANSTDVNFTSIAADGPVVHVCWTDNRQGAGANQYDYFSISSQSNGTDFATQTEYRHTTFPTPLTWAAPRRPRAAVDVPHVYTFMEHSINGEDDVWMDWSTDLGLNFQVTGVAINSATLGTAGDVDDFYVVADEGRVAVVYVDDRLSMGANNNNLNQAIVSVSYNAGADFQAGIHTEVPLSLKDPNPIYGIDMVGDLIAVVYETNCAAGEDFAISLSSDAGQSFTHYDVTSFGGCGQFPGGVDVDDPYMTLTRNGDCIVTWIDDRTLQAMGGGNTVNNQWITSIHWPQLIDRTATNQGMRYQDDSPNSAGSLVLVALSGTGTATPWNLNTLGFSLNLSFDFWTNASIGGAFSGPPGPGNLNLNVLGANGTVDFALIPNPTALIGLPFWAAAVTIEQSGLGKFTDPVRF